jgi:hypothetical protein
MTNISLSQLNKASILQALNDLTSAKIMLHSLAS